MSRSIGCRVSTRRSGGSLPGFLRAASRITVKSDGSLYLGTLVVRRDQAASEIVKLHAKSPERAIAVRGDKDVPYGDVVEVLDACRAAGYDDVKLVTQRRDDSPAR